MKTNLFIFYVLVIISSLQILSPETLYAQWQTSGSDIYYNGKVGIKKNVPEYELEIAGMILADHYLMKLNIHSGFNISERFSYDQKMIGHYSYGWYLDTWYPTAATLWLSGYAGIKFFTNGTPQLSINNSGNVGIGTTNPTSKLTVAGDIRAREITVEANAGADFVFAPDYRLRPLTEVEQFITANKHLPDIAPADSMVQNGVNMGEMQIQLLQKIEELTLYMIEQSKQNEELKLQMQKQHKRIEELENITQNNNR